MSLSIFGTPPADPAAKPSGVAVDADLYGADTPAPKEMHPPEVALRDTFRGRLEDVSKVLGLSEAQRHTRHREFVDVLRTVGLDAHAVGKPLYAALTDAQIRVARGTPIDEAQQRRQEEDLRGTFLNTYPRDGEQLLERTRAFVKAHPKLQAMVGTGGVATDATAMTAIAEHVRTTFWKP